MLEGWCTLAQFKVKDWNLLAHLQLPCSLTSFCLALHRYRSSSSGYKRKGIKGRVRSSSPGYKRKDYGTPELLSGWHKILATAPKKLVWQVTSGLSTKELTGTQRFMLNWLEAALQKKLIAKAIFYLQGEEPGQRKVKNTSFSKQKIHTR